GRAGGDAPADPRDHGRLVLPGGRRRRGRWARHAHPRGSRAAQAAGRTAEPARPRLPHRAPRRVDAPRLPRGAGRTMTPRLKHRLEYGAFRAALGALNTLPPAVARSVGAGVASFGFRPLRIRADHVRRNLERAFPEQTQEWRDRIAAESYAHLGREMIAMMQLSRMSHDELIARTEVVDYERVSRMMRESEGGTGVAGGHFGNWEIGTATMAARGYPVNLVAQRQANPLFDAYLVDARRRLGINVIERRQAPRLGLRALRRGEILVFGADQNAGRNGIFVPFFGH